MSQSVDPEFIARVAAYKANQKRGLAFAAEGTLGGQITAAPRPAWRPKIVRRILRPFVWALLLKISLFHIAAMAGYNARAQVLLDNSNIAEKAMVVLFYPDQISVWVSQQLRIGQHYLTFELRKMF